MLMGMVDAIAQELGYALVPTNRGTVKHGYSSGVPNTGAIVWTTIVELVYDLKSVGPVEFKLVAPMPEQLQKAILLVTPRRNALLWSSLVLGWVQRN